MHADVSAGRRIWGARAAGGVRTGRLTVLEKDGEILRRVERKVLDPHTGVVHDQPRLAGQPTGKTPPAAAAASNSSNAFRKQAGPPLARTHGSAPLALRVRRPVCAPIEEQIWARGCGQCGTAWRPIDEPVRGKLDAILEDERRRDERMELFINLIKTKILLILLWRMNPRGTVNSSRGS